MEIYLDTHVVVWAYAGETELFPGGVREYIEQGDLLFDFPGAGGDGGHGPDLDQRSL